MKTLISISICLTVMSGAGSALALEIPPACQANDSNTRAYQSGYLQGLSLVQRAWRDDCNQLDQLSDTIVYQIQSHAPPVGSTYLLCRHAGMVASAMQKLDDIWTACKGECCLEGQTMGIIGGQIYCLLSILLQGLSAPDDFIRHRQYTRCSLAFQVCCESEFINTSKNYIGQDPFGASVQCSAYTEYPFTDFWNAARELHCSTPPVPASKDILSGPKAVTPSTDGDS